MNAPVLVRLLMGLRALAPDVFPGRWVWAVAFLGVVVGLLPAGAALLVALVRKGVGSRYGMVTSTSFAVAGLLGAGLLPLAVFNRIGRLFSDPAGIGGPAARELGAGGLIGVSQRDYLGGVTVGEAFTGSDPFWLGYAILALGLTPLLVIVFVYVEARLALRRGPRWPATFFWVPILAVAVLTVGVPAGTAGTLWTGAGIGSLVGLVVLAFVGPPSQAVVARSLARPSGRPGGPAVSRRPPPPTLRPVAPPPTPRPTAARPPISRSPAPRPAAPPPTPRPPVSRSPAPRPVTASAARPVSLTGAPTRRPTLVGGMPPVPAAATPARFRIVRKLGSGGFGRVWLAQDAKLGHVVAVKSAHAPDAETELRIQREARALAAVRHPHCVRIHDLVPARSDPGLEELDGMVIVMGYVEGDPLGDLVRSRGLLDDVAAARVWVNLAGALDAAHQQGVMHRDVKPANVVVDRAGRAHLIDFGIARRTGDATMTQTGFVLGTPDFLAPEIACGERASAASDAWQLAATVSYALTGSPPRGDHQDAVSGLRAAAAGAPLSHLPGRTAHLALLRAALANDPNRRPPLRDVQRALDDWLRRQGAPASGPVTAGAPPR